MASASCESHTKCNSRNEINELVSIFDLSVCWLMVKTGGELSWIDLTCCVSVYPLNPREKKFDGRY